MVSYQMPVKKHARTGLRRMMIRPVLTIIAVAAVTSGCVNRDISDLEAYKERILARKSTKVEPLPEPGVYEIFAYEPSSRRDPFQPLFEQAPIAKEDNQLPGNGIKPDTDRPRQELEQFPLDALRMVGTLENAESTWGIILDREGTVYRVRTGDYMGQNFGKIISVEEDGIEMTEIIPDGLGGWQERSASLALIE